jgi:sortase A
MTASRVVSGAGRTIIALGAIVLLFLAYQLWGTGIQHQLAQDHLEDEFEENLDLVAAGPTRSNSESDAAVQVVDSISTDESVVADVGDVTYTQEVVDLLPLLYPAAGQAAARLTIPSIGLDEIVVTGVDADDLRQGPGLYDFAPLPGQPGNAAIAGHRTTYGAPFHRLDELHRGDQIIVQTLQGTFTYEVFGQAIGEDIGHFIVPPDAVEVLDDHGDNRLTLTACHPKYSARQRIIVQAGLVGEPKVALPRPGQAVVGTAQFAGTQFATREMRAGQSAAGLSAGEVASPEISASGFGQGLGGDRSAVIPAVLWALAATLIWFTAWYLGHALGKARRRRWPVHLLAVVPFALVLFMSFVRIDQALPAY